MPEIESYHKRSVEFEDEEEKAVDSEPTDFNQLLTESRERLKNVEDEALKKRISEALNDLQSLFEVTDDSSALEDLVSRLNKEVLDEEDYISADQNLGYIEKDIKNLIH